MVSQNFVPVLKDKKKWISHKNHLDKLVLYDHVFYSNPSDQIEEKLPILPDWTNLFFNEIIQRILAMKGEGGVTVRDIFTSFDQDGSKYVTREEFVSAIKRLGFAGEGNAAVTDEEINALMDSADTNGDGQIDFKEFYDLILAAVTNAEQKTFLERQRDSISRSDWLLSNGNQRISDKEVILTVSSQSSLPITKAYSNTRALGDLEVDSVRLYPRECEDGVWPSDYQLSDHSIVEVVFKADILGPVSAEEIIDPEPVAPPREKTI